jgi:pimeloyl-ACP methyl ester carboxylesterase
LEQRIDPGAAQEWKVTALVLQLALLLHGHNLTVHVSKPAVQNELPLIVYATGDAGWKRGDRKTYEKLTSWGYPVVGFASPDYLKHLGGGVKTVAPDELSRDYAAIIGFAKAQAAIAPETPVVLLGVSRGAGLSVVAAGRAPLGGRINGVVAVGLTREEEYADAPDLYGLLSTLGALPVAVVQSTGDGYLPAVEARQLFGADSAHRQLLAIPANNHNFSSARDAMYDAIHSSLTWIDAHY